MHTYKVPSTAIDKWLESYPSIEGNYGHLLLEQKSTNNSVLAEELRPYFESAHADARRHFHELIGLDLHPEAGAPGSHAEYPRCLPATAKHGLFGEVMAGLVTEHFQFVGSHDWKVPIFLFRHHEDVEKYLFALARDDTRKRAVFGRFGSDFIAIAIDNKGQVVRYLAGEAKWRATLTTAVVDTLLLGTSKKDAAGNTVRAKDGIWNQLNKDTQIPHGLRQLQRLLKDRDPDSWAAAITSMDMALLLKNPAPLPRTNLVLISGNTSAKKAPGVPFVGWEHPPSEYSPADDLQVVELILTDGETLIASIYSSLWDEAL